MVVPGAHVYPLDSTRPIYGVYMRSENDFMSSQTSAYPIRYMYLYYYYIYIQEYVIKYVVRISLLLVWWANKFPTDFHNAPYIYNIYSLRRTWPEFGLLYCYYTADLRVYRVVIYTGYIIWEAVYRHIEMCSDKHQWHYIIVIYIYMETQNVL